jgi:hypothetical protein
MKDIQTKAKNNSLYISLIYVGLGTLSVLCSYPPYYGDWVLLILLITFPVSIFGFAVMTAGKYYLLAFIVQLVVFFVFWFFSYKFILKRYISKHQE